MNHDIAMHRWRTEGFIIIFAIIMFSFVLVPHLVLHERAYLFLQCSFWGLMLAIVYSIRSSLILGIIEFGCLISFIIFDSLSLYYQEFSYMLIAYTFSAIFLFVVIFDLTRSIIYSSYINTNLIFGSLVAYILAGILWGKLYFIENTIYPGSFHSFQNILNFKSMDFGDSYDLQFNLIYYSFSVLTTLGIGDIIPLTNQAKSLTLLEAIGGQVFLGTIIAKLVSTWRYSMLKERGQECQGESRKIKQAKDQAEIL